MTAPVRLRFDFVDANHRPAPLAFEQPRRVIEVWRLDEVIGAIAEAEAERAAGHYVAGFVSYEAAAACDSALKTKPAGRLPLVWFGVFDAPSNETPPPWPAENAPARHDDSSSFASEWTPDVSRADYDAAIARIRDAIEAGDSYQTNYTFRLRSRLDVASLADRYHRLRAVQGASYAAYLDIGRWRILSLSPELFFRLEDRTLTTRPMKGTTGRGRFGAEDDARAEGLRSSPKNRAENVMIVDLMRNDIGRIAEGGSVEVPSLFDIERYPSVFQMTSTVTGLVRQGTTVVEVFASLFPSCSITGAPKTSSMRLIADLERAPRGVYCGAIGVMTPGGHAAFNVAIRTAVVDAGTGDTEYGVGGGITWDSSTADEYAEALSKAGFFDVPPWFALIETMRLENGTFIRRQRHLERIARSAAYFGRPVDVSHIGSVLDEHARIWPDGTRRARLVLTPSGAATVESQAFEPATSDKPIARVALARSPVSSRDLFLFHKTTHRGVYDRHRAAHPDTFDVLLWNERRWVTEFTIGNLVVELDGRRWTPAVECGLLAGIFREELLDTGVIVERVVTIDDVRRAERVWLINSLREWVPVMVTGWEAASSGEVAATDE